MSVFFEVLFAAVKRVSHLFGVEGAFISFLLKHWIAYFIYPYDIIDLIK